jgi:hypothetical protein
MGVLDLVGKAAKGAKKAAPFFSKADIVLDELPRGKGLGNEFLAELVKKGAKPTELKERGIEKALKDAPKMTKAEVQKIFEEKAPPKVKEEIRGGYEYQEALDQKAQEMIGDENVGFDDLYGRDKERAEAAVEQELGYNPETKFDTYKTPGGDNYREILLKIPQRGLNEIDKRNMMLYEADIRRGKELDPWHQKQYSALKEKEAAGSQDYYHKNHWGDTPNVLAHIRVQDYISPTYTKQQAEDIGKRIAEGMGVADPKNLGSGSIRVAIKNGYVTPKEAAQYADFRKFRGENTTGAKQKVLLVDEIQSDWHQEGRKKGYRTADIESRREELTTMAAPYIERGERVPKEIYDELTSLPNNFAPPDAPFKKNWHELSMKRILDYAAENGYDSVAITPGVQQVKRYEDATRQAVDEVAMYGDTLVGFKDGRRVIEQPISSPDELEQYIGKDMAQKLSSAAPDMNFIRSIKGEDLTVGGEGMKGFYDKILPDYLNNYGKKYGAQMGQINLQTPNMDSWNLEDSARFHGMSGAEYLDSPNRSQLEKQFLESRKNQTSGFHSFDITPQMREEIRTKGQPMYGKVATPVLEGLAAGSGAATIGSEVFDTNNEQQVQNPVHFTENPDAMLLELMQRN